MSIELIKYLPPHVRYFEPFFGGGSMYFRKHKADWNILSDLDNDLINLYMCVIHKFDEFTNMIYWTPRSRHLHNIYRDDIKATQEIDIPDPERAYKYYYIVRNAFNTKPMNTFSKDTAWNTRMVKELKYSREKLNGAVIENLDFEELVDRYGVREGDLYYLDPPYVVAGGKDYYRNYFDEKTHLRLRNTVNSIDGNGGKFMISYDDNKEIREMYNRYNIIEITTKYAGRNSHVEDTNKEFTELVIMNYEITTNQTNLF